MLKCPRSLLAGGLLVALSTTLACTSDKPSESTPAAKTAEAARPEAPAKAEAPAAEAKAEVKAEAKANQPLLPEGYYKVVVEAENNNSYEVGLTITETNKAEISSYFNPDDKFVWSGTVYAEGVASPEGTRFVYRSHVNSNGDKSDPPGATQETVLFTISKAGEALSTTWVGVTYPGKVDPKGFQPAEPDPISP